MNIGEFAEARGIKADTVRKYISNHKKDFDGHTHIQDKKLVIDEEAQSILDKVYPMPKPVQVIKGVPEEEHREVLDKVIKLQDEIIKLNMALSQLQLESSTREYLIEQKETEKTKLTEEIEQLKNLNDKLSEELEAEKNKSWLSKLLGK